MAESRLIPSNLMAWPKVRTLLPDQKLIVYHLWATAGSDAGCWLLDLSSFASSLNINETAILAALREFDARCIVKTDDETGEVMINDWFRWHKFTSPARKNMLEVAIRKILSPDLQKRVKSAAECVFPLESSTCALNEKK